MFQFHPEMSMLNSTTISVSFTIVDLTFFVVDVPLAPSYSLYNISTDLLCPCSLFRFEFNDRNICIIGKKFVRNFVILITKSSPYVFRFELFYIYLFIADYGVLN